MSRFGWPLTILVRTSVRYAGGSTSLSLQVSKSEAMVAQCSAPLSDPENRAFLRLSAMGRIERSTVAGIAIDLQNPLEALEMGDRPLGRAIGRVDIGDPTRPRDGRRRHRPRAGLVRPRESITGAVVSSANSLGKLP
jgi:hypothetical protein